jgi:diguanylate cyclase
MTEKNENSRRELPLHRIIVLTAVIMSLFMGISGVACLLFYRSTADSKRYRMEVRQKTTLNIALQSVCDYLQGVVGDLNYLGSKKEILATLVEGSAPAKARLQEDFLNFARHKGIYDQVRLLNADGWEVVRVNFNDGQPNMVAQDRLQNKRERYYFAEVAGAPRGAVYLSDFDLNRESKRIERPLKPMIRFSQPIFNDDDRFLGALVLNCLGQPVLNRLADEGHSDDGDLMLVSYDGYWLLNPDPALQWGFMLPERSGHRFSRIFPKEWQTVAAGAEGQISTVNGMFAFKTLSPGRWIAKYRGAVVKVGFRSDKWLFVHHISKKVLHRIFGPLQRNLFILWAIMALFTAVPAWLLASAFLKRRLAQYKMWHMANFDTLTGLYNRSSFIHELEQAVLQGLRYHSKFILLYLDLDGFKQVNDTLGHAAGDLLLKQTAERFRATVRTSDCVARLGGDEFSILVRETGTYTGAAKVAGKLITALAAPFDLDRQTGRIGCSIGIARFPADGDTADYLLRIADRAMYEAKAGGKNRFCFFQPETGPSLNVQTSPA